MTENPYETGQPAIEATEAVAKSGCGKFIIAGCAVLGILGLLVLFLLPALRRSPEPAYRYFCKKNLDDISAAMHNYHCLLYTSPSPRDRTRSRMPSSA